MIAGQGVQEVLKGSGKDIYTLRFETEQLAQEWRTGFELIAKVGGSLPLHCVCMLCSPATSARACCAAEDCGGKKIDAVAVVIASMRETLVAVDARGIGGMRHWWLYQTSEDCRWASPVVAHDLAVYWARAQRISCRRCRLATGCFKGSRCGASFALMVLKERARRCR